MSPDDRDGGWATRPQDTRERTCECGLPGLSVLHTFRVARHPDPSTVTVTRTYEATVEWTADLPVPAWLRAIAAVAPAYEADRFGAGEGSEGSSGDGRFRAAPVDATLRPAGTHPAGLSDPYHYWNTPLARLLADDEYPAAVTSLTVDLLDGPKALWCGDATAGVDAGTLPGDRDEYARVGLEFTARERFRRPSGEGTGGGGAGDDADSPANRWSRAGDPAPPATDQLGPLVEATLASPAREWAAGEAGVGGLVGSVESRVGSVWRAFRRSEDDPYAIPGPAVEAATAAFDP